MSLVRISEALTTAVTKQVDVVGKKAYELLVSPLDPTKDEETRNTIHAAGVTKLWAKYAHLRDSTPVEWLKTSPRLDIKISDATDIGEIQIEKESKLPPNIPTGYSYTDVTLKLANLPPELMPKLAAFNTARVEHNAKFTQIKEEVIGFLKHSRSLNDALKRFPDLALYIPKEFLNRIQHKVERNGSGNNDASERKELNIDRNMIVAAGVLGALHK